MADYVRNVWYMAAWEREVPDDGMLARTLLDRNWVIFRQSNGGYAMLEDRCPHRFAPLSMGTKRGDVVHCRYHGLGFDGAGACVHSPFPSDPPANVRANALPITARHNGLWFWPGDPKLANPDLIPDFSFLDRDDIGLSRLLIEGNYELVTDNLMDLSHVEFLHHASFGLNGAIFQGRHSVKAEQNGCVWNNWDMDDVDPPQWARPMLEAGAKVDHWLYMRWQAPASMMLTIGLAHAGANRESLIVPTMLNAHIVTPATSKSSHYFFDHEATPEAEALMKQAFVDEDEPMIEAVQRALGDTDFWDAEPAIIATDAGAIAVRRRLAQMRRAEAHVDD